MAEDRTNISKLSREAKAKRRMETARLAIRQLEKLIEGGGSASFMLCIDVEDGRGTELTGGANDLALVRFSASILEEAEQHGHEELAFPLNILQLVISVEQDRKREREAAKPPTHPAPDREQ